MLPGQGRKKFESISKDNFIADDDGGTEEWPFDNKIWRHLQSHAHFSAFVNEFRKMPASTKCSTWKNLTQIMKSFSKTLLTRNLRDLLNLKSLNCSKKDHMWQLPNPRKPRCHNTKVTSPTFNQAQFRWVWAVENSTNNSETQKKDELWMRHSLY